MAKRISARKEIRAVMMYDSGVPVKSILELVHIDSKTLYKYLRIANIRLRKPWFCNHHPKNPKVRRDTNEE